MDFDPSQLTTPDEEVQARIAALRGQQMQGLGLLGQLSGDKVLAPIGQSLTQGAQHQMGLLEQIKARRAQMTATASDRSTDNARQAEALAETRRHNRATEGQAGQVLGLRELLAATKKETAEGNAEAKADQQLQKEREALGKDITEAHGRGSELVKNTSRRNASQRVLSTLLDPQGNVRTDLNQQQARAMVADFQAMMGASQAENALHGIVPDSLASNAENFIQYLTGKQRPAHLENLLGPFVDAAKGEEATIGAQNRQLIQQELLTHAALIKKDKQAQNMVKAHGVRLEDLDPETLMPKEDLDPALVGQKVRAESAKRRAVVARIQELRAGGVSDPAQIKARLVSEGFQ